jgi:hypothetical protein
MNGDMDPGKWTPTQWALFLLNILAPTIVIVVYVLARIGLI